MQVCKKKVKPFYVHTQDFFNNRFQFSNKELMMFLNVLTMKRFQVPFMLEGLMLSAAKIPVIFVTAKFTYFSDIFFTYNFDTTRFCVLVDASLSSDHHSNPVKNVSMITQG